MRRHTSDCAGKCMMRTETDFLCLTMHQEYKWQEIFVDWFLWEKLSGLQLTLTGSFSFVVKLQFSLCKSVVLQSGLMRKALPFRSESFAVTRFRGFRNEVARTDKKLEYVRPSTCRLDFWLLKFIPCDLWRSLLQLRLHVISVPNYIFAPVYSGLGQDAGYRLWHVLAPMEEKSKATKDSEKELTKNRGMLVLW